MCLLCDQARGRQFQASQRADDGRALYGLSIAPADLLDDGSVEVTRQARVPTVFSITTCTARAVQ